jgi:hypothetical protein
MFLQVYADGTVIDGEGVHNLGREGIKGVLEVLQSGDLSRVRGHCGAPPTDFLELVQMIVYDRSLGRLRANAFSFSGNSQGCDNTVRRLQTALDSLQSRLSRRVPATAAAHLPSSSMNALSNAGGASLPGPTIPLQHDSAPSGHE